MITKIMEYNDDTDEVSMAWDFLTDVCQKIANDGEVAKYGYFGSWNGPEYGGSIIDTPELLRGHICQDFSVPMSFTLEYTDEDTEINPTQRYCSSTPLKIPAHSYILKQWHHDGCNCYVIRPVKKGKTYNNEGKTTFIQWCEKNTKNAKEIC